MNARVGTKTTVNLEWPVQSWKLGIYHSWNAERRSSSSQLILRSMTYLKQANQKKGTLRKRRAPRLGTSTTFSKNQSCTLSQYDQLWHKNPGILQRLYDHSHGSLRLFSNICDDV
jgi:hypothetical protein